MVNQMLTNDIEFKSGIKNNPMELETISLGRIMRWFKGQVKYESGKIIPLFKWQRRFYDRVVRNEKELYFIREYIINNTLNCGQKILVEYFEE